MSPHRPYLSEPFEDIRVKTSLRNFIAILATAISLTAGGMVAWSNLKGESKQNELDIAATKAQVATLGSSVAQDHDLLLRIDGKLDLLLEQDKGPAGR